MWYSKTEILKKCPEITKYQLEVKTKTTRDCDIMVNELIKIFPNIKSCEKIIVTLLIYIF